MTACPDQETALHALTDGELDTLATIALEAHLRGCAGCRSALARLEALRAAIRTPGVHPAPPPALRAKVAALAPARPSAHPAWGSFAGGGVFGALAASLAVFLLAPVHRAPPTLAAELVSGHLRSLQAEHLVDVATSDRHTVKPWFNGKVDFAPPVPDLSVKGFPLAGGRLDVLGGRTVAVLVYKRRQHSINLYVRPAPGGDSAPETLRRDSYALVGWRAGGLEYWAVSDMDTPSLELFGAAFRAAA